MQLQGIMVIELQGNDLIVSFQARKYIQSTKIYLFTKSIFFQGNYICSRNYIYCKEIRQIKGNYIHSRKYNHSIQGNYIH